MCLAVPMRVIEINDLVALVDLEGIQLEVRLDIVDHRPMVGDYLIIHAGFALHTLDPTEAEINLRLIREMADGLNQPPEHDPEHAQEHVLKGIPKGVSRGVTKHAPGHDPERAPKHVPRHAPKNDLKRTPEHNLKHDLKRDLP
ncbi:MAG: HypC/HybG/HupF family hydrogenase formation chaperone [Desulfobulbaceae bacterium]|nr:MAG: HypC/HybG/HupF family hydrogenase formation chaperone [Desulfobulbaceae bacterium]